MWPIFLALLLAQPSDASHAEASRLFDLGTELFAHGDHGAAVAAYHAAESTGWTSGALQYNLGTAHLALGNMGRAILHFERAERLMSGDARLRHNSRLAREQAGVEARPSSPTANLAARLLGTRNPLPWLTGGLVLFLFLATIVGFRFWNRRREPWLRRTTVALAIPTLALLAVGFTLSTDARADWAVVVDGEARVFAAPTSTAPSLGSLAPGEPVRIVEEQQGWHRVRPPKGPQGWIPSRAAERI